MGWENSLVEKILGGFPGPHGDLSPAVEEEGWGDPPLQESCDTKSLSFFWFPHASILGV